MSASPCTTGNRSVRSFTAGSGNSCSRASMREARRRAGPSEGFGARSVSRAARPNSWWLDRWLGKHYGDVAARLYRPAPRLRRMAKHVEALEPEIKDLAEAALREAVEDLRAQLLGKGFVAPLVARAFALVREASRRHLGLRQPSRADHGRLGAARGPLDRDGHRRGQDPDRRAADLHRGAGRRARACRDGERLPFGARRGLREAALRCLRFDGGLVRARAGPADAPRRLCLRRHLLHQQGRRVRLSARSPGHRRQACGRASRRPASCSATPAVGIPACSFCAACTTRSSTRPTAF